MWALQPGVWSPGKHNNQLCGIPGPSKNTKKRKDDDKLKKKSKAYGSVVQKYNTILVWGPGLDSPYCKIKQI